MDLRNVKEQKLMQTLNNIAKIISQVQKQYSFQRICVMYKRISQQLGKIIDYIKRGQLQLDHKCYNLLRQCMENILIMVKSTQYDKYSHHIPIFQYLVKVYQQTFKTRLQIINSQIIIERIEKNQYSSYYQKLSEINFRQRSFIQSINLTNSILNITDGQIIIQDPKCICCSRVFIKELEIINQNPCFPNVRGLTALQVFGEVHLERQISALCNSGGGAIIIGTQQKNGKFVPVGINCKNQEMIEEKKLQIQKKIHQIKPKLDFKIQILRVHTNFINEESVFEEENRVCFRVQINLKQKEKINYIQISKIGYHSKYQFYKFENDNVFGKCLKLQANHGQKTDFYTLAHKIYYESKKRKAFANAHANIKCYNPLKEYSKLYKIFLQSPDKLHNTGQVGSIIENDVNIDHPLDPKIKYQYVTLLAVGSKQNQRYIKELDDYLKAKKYKYQISKPFINCFQQGSRYIEMMSHYDKFLKVKQLVEQKKTFEKITVIPVLKTIQVYKDKLTEQSPKYKQFQQKFKNRYPHGYKLVTAKIADKDNNIKYVYQFSFNTLVQSIYAYLIFQQIQVKAFFIKNTAN